MLGAMLAGVLCDPATVSACYTSAAVVRDTALASRVVDSACRLGQVKFDLAPDSVGLDDAWPFAADDGDGQEPVPPTHSEHADQPPLSDSGADDAGADALKVIGLEANMAVSLVKPRGCPILLNAVGCLDASL